MNSRFVLEISLLPSPRSCNSNHSKAFITTASRCMMKMWWSRPEMKGLRTTATVCVIHLWEDAPILPPHWVWGINVRSKQGVHPSCYPHSSMLQTKWSRLPEAHPISHHKYNYSLFQLPCIQRSCTKPTLGHPYPSASSQIVHSFRSEILNLFVWLITNISSSRAIYLA